MVKVARAVGHRRSFPRLVVACSRPLAVLAWWLASASAWADARAAADAFSASSNAIFSMSALALGTRLDKLSVVIVISAGRGRRRPAIPRAGTRRFDFAKKVRIDGPRVVPKIDPGAIVRRVTINGETDTRTRPEGH